MTSGVVGAVLITFIVVMVGDDLSRIAGSTLLAGIGLVTGLAPLLWFWSLGTVDEHDQPVTPFGGTALWGAVFAGAIFALGTLPRRRQATSTDDVHPDG